MEKVVQSHGISLTAQKSTILSYNHEEQSFFTMIKPLFNVLLFQLGGNIYLFEKFGDNFCAASLKSFFVNSFTLCIFIPFLVTYFI